MIHYFQGVLQTNIKVRVMKEAKQWYTEILGLHVEKDYDSTVVLSFGGDNLGTLCLIEAGGEGFDCGSTYPVLRISEEYKDVLYKRLAEKGVQVEENPVHPSHFTFYDPDGNKLEAYCPGIYEEH
ncbi:VOC family protein [Rossellomorea arthrocnemi]|jgi:catechol 2,3-dioxygenase-like lactoylglutathione lyase family enzyme|uniref:VOC family protein n=1 Tax=Rossellomorea arthrocnemi TaxID=2769542 RepID=UPI001917F44C|nr:VOC family protein [Rossellomorea arthrocnemi]